jgi:hypothetical protein
VLVVWLRRDAGAAVRLRESGSRCGTRVPLPPMTKEVIGGFAVVDLLSREQALEC